MKKIELTKGKFAIVDKEDYDELIKNSWFVNGGRTNTYASRASGKDAVMMHRQIMGIHKSDNRQVDHINHDGLDNRKENLRVCTRSENLRNKRLYKGSKSRYIGVDYKKDRGRWRARLTVGGRVIEGGTFKTEEEAGRKRDAMAIEHHGNFANLNFKD